MLANLSFSVSIAQQWRRMARVHGLGTDPGLWTMISASPSHRRQAQKRSAEICAERDQLSGSVSVDGLDCSRASSLDSADSLDWDLHELPFWCGELSSRGVID